MNKIVKNILAVGGCIALSLGMMACEFNEKEKLTAYDIAVENGFVGTEEEWLHSLKGANGEDGKDLDAEALYEAAKNSGYQGSFLDFCKELNVTASATNDTKQLSENMMSVVSIYCGYSVTSSGWFGYGGSTSYGSQAGSGVIVELNKQAGNATIITNYHVVYNKESDAKGILDDIWIYPHGAYNAFDPKEGDVNGDGIKARFIGGAMDYDIAVLRVEGSEYIRNSQVTAAEFGNSDEVTVGEETYVIGNPAGAGIAITNGILSVDSEYIGISALDNRDENHDGEVDTVAYRVMRTSAAINGGNSGGGMFNRAGKLIGIVNAKSASSETDNMGYALPGTQVKAVYENILDNGRAVKQATLGILVSLKSSKAVVNKEGKVEIVEEFLVSTEAERGSAAYGKLSTGDVFLTMTVNDGEAITLTRKHQLIDRLLTVRKGDTVHFTVRNADGALERVSIDFNEDAYFTTYA